MCQIKGTSGISSWDRSKEPEWERGNGTRWMQKTGTKTLCVRVRDAGEGGWEERISMFLKILPHPMSFFVYWHRRCVAEIKLRACYCYFIIPWILCTAYAVYPRRGKAWMSCWLLEKNKSAKSTHWEQIMENNIKIISLRISAAV